jgi:uncharacterized protein YcnI
VTFLRRPAVALVKGRLVMTNTTVACLLRGTVALSISAGSLALGLSPSAAHVRATPASTAAGSPTQIDFSVLNESDKEATNKLELRFPLDTPFTSVHVKPIEGWTVRVAQEELPEPLTLGNETVTEAVATITWTADASHDIAPGEFQIFTIFAGPLPTPGTTMMMPATQTYTDGSTVVWDQPVLKGEETPDHPAPLLTATEPVAGTGGHAVHGAPAPDKAAGQAAPTQNQPASTGLVWVAVVAGALGLLAGALALARTRGKK